MDARNRLPRSLSLKSREEIDRLFQTGRRYSGNFFTLIYLPSEDFKYGVFVSKKHGTAPVRNRIKRLYREAVRTGGRQILESGRAVILPRRIDRKTLRAEFEAIKADVCRVFENARVN